MVTEKAHLITGQARCRNDQFGCLASGLLAAWKVAQATGSLPYIKRSAPRNFVFSEHTKLVQINR